jgi:ProQ/FINO family
MTQSPKTKTTLTTFSMLGSALTRPASQLPPAPANPPQPPPATTAKPAPKPLAARAEAVALAPSPVPALPESAEDQRIAARVAALVVAREKFPDVFNDDCCPPLPGDMFRQLCEVGVAADVSNDVIRWWVSTPGYKRAKAKRIDRSIAARVISLATLRELAPAVFDADKPVPLAIGVHEQLTELGLSAKETGDLLRWWTRRHEYYTALARGGSRYNLDASVAGPVGTEDQAHAGRKASEPRRIGRRKGAVAR